MSGMPVPSKKQTTRARSGWLNPAACKPSLRAGELLAAALNALLLRRAGSLRTLLHAEPRLLDLTLPLGGSLLQLRGRCHLLGAGVAESRGRLPLPGPDAREKSRALRTSRKLSTFRPLDSQKASRFVHASWYPRAVALWTSTWPISGMVVSCNISTALSASSSDLNSTKAKPAKPVSTLKTRPAFPKASSNSCTGHSLFTLPTQTVAFMLPIPCLPFTLICGNTPGLPLPP
mmetsp:Transcript_2588/g.5533  ORF Transcript_2588/g.5533 Transcript_2588/m.5533 type:complete len:232 (-) Transcript_2588:37-732(-)